MNPSRQLAKALLDACGRWKGERVGLTQGRTSITYDEIAGEVLLLAGEYSRYDVERCMLVPAPSTSSVTALFALLEAEKIPFLADPTWEASMLASVSQRCGCDGLVGRSPEGLGSLRPGLALDALSASQGMLTLEANLPRPAIDASTAFVRFSSGSTGRPRALEFSPVAAINAAESWTSASRLNQDDRIFCLASLNNGLAFNTSLLSTFLAGASLHLYAGLMSPKAILRELVKVKPTVLVGFPFILELLLNEPVLLAEAAAAMRLVVSSAAPLKVEVAERWMRVAGVPIGHYYGIAETGPITFNQGSHSESSGHCIEGVELLCTGSAAFPAPIRVRTSYQATCYVPDGLAPLADSLDESGFFCSSDLGYVSEEGLHVTGRTGRVGNIAGKKFSLDDVEQAISRLEGIEEVHVSIESELLTAFVKGQQLDISALRSACLHVLPAGQVPHRFLHLPYLPKSAAGKINLQALKMLSQGSN